MKKRILALTSFIAVLAAFTGCGSTSSSSSSSQAATTAAVTTEATTEATTAATTAETKTTTAKTTEATTEATTEDTTVEADEFDFALIAGSWTYEEPTGTPVGGVDIAEDGRYAYTDGSSLITGSIEYTYEEFPGDAKVPILIFTHDSNEFFIGCYLDENADFLDHLDIGNGGMSRLVRGKYEPAGSTGSEDGEEPNQYGFYEYKEPIRDNAGFNSVKTIEGNWLHGQFVLEITDCDEYMGAFSDANESGEYVGTVRLEYSKNADDTIILWYNLYTNDGGLYKSFKLTNEIPLDIIVDECENGIEHERIILDEE